VTAIDFSPDMVRETAKDIESRKLSHAEIRHMDAEQMNLPMRRSIGSCAALPFGCSLNLRVLQEFYRA
jgi:ubiquinone/menaquinone biosynthesis C-methylase UbiE